MLSVISCSPLHHINLIQSDKRIKKTEYLNFTEEKAMTQWWYYDCVFDDGSVLVLLFTPYQWWDEFEKMPTNKSLFYLSYMNAQGNVISQRKVFDASEVQYAPNSIKSSCFEITRAHDKSNRIYSINFFLDSINGTININSIQKAFSPFPRGSMSATISNILKKKVKGLAYRYAAHVTEGKVHCNINMNENLLALKGKAYHEQGWVTGTADQLGDGWTWFHFVSKNINIFGTSEQFFSLEKHGKRLYGGLNKKCSISEMNYSDTEMHLLTRGNLTFHSNKISFGLTPTGTAYTPLIVMSSVDTDQLWGSVLQPTAIKFRYKKTELEETGVMLLETCRMKK